MITELHKGNQEKSSEILKEVQEAAIQNKNTNWRNQFLAVFFKRYQIKVNSTYFSYIQETCCINNGRTAHLST